MGPQTEMIDQVTAARFIINRVSLGIMAVDGQGRVTFFNPEASRICGIDPADVIGHSVDEVFPSFPAEAQVVQRALSEGRSYRSVRQDINYQGCVWHLLTTAEPIRNEIGEVIGSVVMFSDVANLVALEQRARDAERLASVGRMTAGTVHEIRNPLATIRGFVQLFVERFSALGQPGDAQLARAALSEVDRSGKLLTELLQLSRPSIDGWSVTSLEPVIVQTIKLLIEGRADAPQTAIDLAPLPKVFANPDRIGQVITNLWQNAAEAVGARGHVAVTARSLSDVMAVEISDDGPGLSPLIATHLFEPFYTTKEMGTGLGLVICKRIIEDHGGTLSVTDRPGGGVLARFTLPLPSVPER